MRDILYEVEGLLPDAVKLSVAKELSITEDMDTEVDIAARNFGYWAVLAEKAETRYQKLKFNFEAWRARVETSEAKQRAIQKLKPHTEAQMKAFVMSQSKYRAYQSRLIKFEEDRRIVKILAKAFELKKDMVQTKSSNRRNEMKGTR